MMAKRLLPLLGKPLWAGLLLFVLVLMVVPNVGGSKKAEIRISAAWNDLAEIRQALEAYRADNGRFPAELQDLLLKPPGAELWKGPYLLLAEMPIDPWGNPYRYASPGKRSPSGVDVWSTGPDGSDGSEDDVYR
jgi:general secretion pathway protein G